jgi:hypothetical protein
VSWFAVVPNDTTTTIIKTATTTTTSSRDTTVEWEAVVTITVASIVADEHRSLS